MSAFVAAFLLGLLVGGVIDHYLVPWVAHQAWLRAQRARRRRIARPRA